MIEPELSVVVASVNGFPYLARCLDSLTAGPTRTEVIVADWTDEPTRREVRERWPEVRLLSFDEPMAVPELRAAGIAVARAPYVAVIEDHCVVHPHWAERIVAEHRAGRHVVGGGIRNGADERVRDWAAFFCEYSEHMTPLPAAGVASLPGMNVSYDRTALAAIQELLDEGRWETWLHPELVRRGFELRADPNIVLDHVRDFEVRYFASQRFHYARSHAGMRNPELGGRKRLVYVFGSPAIVPLLLWRITANVIRRRHHLVPFVRALPLLVFYLSIWAFGEAVGYAAGGGRSLLKVR